MKFWEKSDNYKKSIEAHQRYIDFLKTSNANVQQIIDAYMRMARFCESMEDRLLATDLYQETVDMMIRNRWDPLMISAVQNKINSLHFY
jgi:hypothetical protein